MPRGLDSAMAAAMTGKVLFPVILVDLTINNEVLHIWSGLGTFPWNGNSYVGVGDLGEIAIAQEGIDIYANGASLTLSGADPADIADAESDVQLGAPATIWLGALNETTLQLVGQPVILFAGLVDAPATHIGAEQGADGSPATATIDIPLESKLAVLGAGQQRVYSRADQNLKFPTDTAFNWVSLNNYLALNWRP